MSGWQPIENDTHLDLADITAVDKPGAIKGEWQPIATAPRDGREILCIQGGFIRVCVPKLLQPGVWEYFRDEQNVPGHTWSMMPTHWMPLPDPPSDQTNAVQP